MFWEVTLDDFNNLCGDGKFPMITRVKEGLSAMDSGGDNDMATTPRPSNPEPPLDSVSCDLPFLVCSLWSVQINIQVLMIMYICK